VKKAIRNLFFLLLVVAGDFAYAQLSSCANADFELNSFANWTGTTGSCCPINSVLPGIVSGRHTIMTGPGTDPNTNGAVTVVAPGGTFSARLGNDDVGGEAEQLSYQIAVDASNALFIYRYAVVLEDPNHTEQEQPRFEIRVYDQNGLAVGCGTYNVVASSGIPGFVSIVNSMGSTIHYKDWTTVGIDLSPYIGQNVTIEFSTGDCALGGHFGYAYVDCYCSPLVILSDLCDGATSTVLTAPVGFESYLWSNGATTQSITVSNVVVGAQYQCTMTSVTGCTMTLSTILTPTLLTAHFNQLSDCKNEVVFDDSSFVTVGTPVNQWEWDFGDGQTSNVQHPTHQYAVDGNYNVSLIVTNMGGCTDTVELTVSTIPIPLVNFNVSAVCPGDLSAFTDASSSVNGPITSWSWDFGDGGTDTLQDPFYRFDLPGTYPVTLIISDSLGCNDTLIQNISTLPGPVSDFNYLSACVNSQINFTDVSAAAGTSIANWEWNFGDASPLVTGVANPGHLYPAPGSYNATLVVTSMNGCKDTIVKPVDVGTVPVAAFSNAIACAGQFTEFLDASSTGLGSITGWQWNFGDGSPVSTEQHPLHVFTSGNYNVQLVVTGSNGCTDTIQQNINALQGPTANFSSTPVCPGSTSTFSNLSLNGAGVINNWEWDFGDGSAGLNSANPQHVFTSAGSFDVSLIVTSTNGCTDTLVSAINTNPIPNAAYFIPSGCVFSSLLFPNLSTLSQGSLASYIWDFGDGSPPTFASSPSHVYTTGGSYFVSMVAISNLGCRDSVTNEVFVFDQPQADFTVNNVCLGDTGFFQDISTTTQGSILDWIWNFGDGSAQVYGDAQTGHKYASIGNYTATLVVMNSAGCFDTLQKNVTVKELPVASFATTGPVCEGNTFTLNNTSTLNGGGIQSQQWVNATFGINTNANPQISFSQSGNHLVQLIVTGTNGCIDSVSGNVVVNALPTSSMLLQNVCEESVSLFTDLSFSVAPITSWSWSFGDGDSSFTQNTSHAYLNDGTYLVNLQVVDANGCRKDSSQSIIIYPKPAPGFITSNECVGVPFLFQNTSTIPVGYSIVNSFWNFGDGSPVDTHTNPTHAFTNPGTYNITYIAESDRGCRDTIADSVQVFPRPNVQFTADTVCEGSPTTFLNASSILSGNISGYNWRFGDQTTSTQINASHIYPSGGVYSATLIATSNRGCIDSLTRPVRVYYPPTPWFQADGLEGCEPLPVSFVDLSTSVDGTVASWSWDFGNSNTSSQQNPPTLFEDDGLFDIRLQIASSHGCVNDTTYNDYILVHPLPVAQFTFDPSEPSVFIPLVYFYDQSLLATQWNWSFGDTTFSTLENPSHEYANPGKYNVQLIVKSEFGCSDTTWEVIDIKKDFAIWIPSAFTPNGDGYNEMFTVKGFGFSIFQMQIFNRWGELIFTSNEMIRGWDGTHKGEPAPQDVYVYKVDIKDDSGVSHTYTGRVSIVR
jgi:gliding motility-associated-like protein